MFFTRCNQPEKPYLAQRSIKMPRETDIKHTAQQPGPMLNTLKLVLITLTLAGSVACDTLESHEAKYLSQARTYLAQSNLDKARIELKNTLQINPNSAEAHLLLGQIEEQRQEWRKAFSHYQKASNLNPELIEPYIKLGHFYLLQAASLKSQGKPAEESEAIQKVSQNVDAALHINNEEIDALLLKASLLAYKEDINAATSLLLETIRKHKHAEDGYLLLAQLYSQRKNPEDATKILTEGLKNLADSTEIKSELARVYTQQGKLDLAINIMQGLVENHPLNLNYSLSLSAYYLQQKQPDKAENVIRETLEHVPDDISRYLILAEFLHKNRSVDDSVSFLEEAIRKHPDESELQFKLADLYRQLKTDTSIAVLNNIVEKWQGKPQSVRAKKLLASIYYEQNKLDDSLTMIKQVLDDNQKDSEALSILGKTSFKQQDYDTAITSFRSALKTQPDSLEMIQLLADAYLLNGEVELANETLKSAIGISPRSTSGRLQLARFNLANKMPTEALQQVNTILSNNQDNIDAIKLKSEILITLSQHKELPALLDRLKTLAPESPEGWFRMGRFYLLNNQPLLAREELEIAWIKAPQALDLLAELTDLEIRLGKLDIAKSRLHSLLEKNPQHPEAHKFLGMIYLVERSYKQAEAEFIAQLEHTPSDPLLYLQLGETSKLKAKLDNAEQYYKKGIQLSEDNIQLQFALADIYERKMLYADAAGLYRAILDQEPANLIAANNLAIIYADHYASTEKLMEARDLLEKFRRSGHPAIIDTLGWVYHKLDRSNDSIPLLQYAINKSPNNPTFNYHLGSAYANAGNASLAKKHLKIALSHEKFTNKAHAMKILNELIQ